MNKILQKHIEEAKKKIIQKYVESFRYENGMELEPAIKNFLEKIGTVFFEHGISFASQNQWISVEEALPKESGDYLVIVKQSSDSEAYFHEISTYNATDNIWFYVGKLIVTHWAEIPSLKGGEE